LHHGNVGRPCTCDRPRLSDRGTEVGFSRRAHPSLTRKAPGCIEHVDPESPDPTARCNKPSSQHLDWPWAQSSTCRFHLPRPLPTIRRDIHISERPSRACSDGKPSNLSIFPSPIRKRTDVPYMGPPRFSPGLAACPSAAGETPKEEARKHPAALELPNAATRRPARRV
jgi:hypothetical protein